MTSVDFIALRSNQEFDFSGSSSERLAGEGDHEHAQPTPGVHVARRGSGREAAQLVRAIIANHDEQTHTAHHIAAETPTGSSYPTASKGSSTAVPTPWPSGETTTRPGADKPATR